MRGARKDGRLRAVGHNIQHDQRLAGARFDAWRQEIEALADDEPAIPDLEAAHRRHFTGEVTALGYGRAALPFTPVNAGARQTPPDGGVRLIRVEDLTWPLGEWKRGEALLFEAFRAARGEPDPTDTLPRDQGQAVLEQFVAAWNGIRDSRAAFGAFHDGVAAELAATDWANALRDRLGLGHLRPRGGKALPVAVMAVPVAEILAPLPPEQRALAFAAPTAVESPGFSEWFFPTPRPANSVDVSYGRVVDLQARGDRLVVEVVHRPIAYRAGHVLKMGWIDRDRPDLPLWEVRNAHLTLLRRDFSGFGEPMSPDEKDATGGPV